MTRAAPLPRRVALGLACVALLGGCGGGGSTTVAHVGGDTISKQQLGALVEHFRREARREGKDFPKDGTTTFVQLRNQLLGLLVYRTELRQAAARLGVVVSSQAFSKRLAANPAGEGDTNGDTYARDSAEAELLKEGIAAKVTRGVTGKTLAERSARRNAKLAAFLARVQRETKVRYEPGYAPGS